MSAEDAVRALARLPWDPAGLLTTDDLARARSALEPASAREPGNIRWQFGLAMADRHEYQRRIGDVKAKRKAARERMEKVVAREPKRAEYQFWYGNICFDGVDDAGMLSKMSIASSGRKAFETAVALDPNHVGARYALGQFYARAPGLAGGSTEKARAEAEALLTLPGGRGEVLGHLLLANIAIQGKDWTAVSREYAAAETARGEGADPASILRSHAGMLLYSKNDPAAALPIVERYARIAKADDPTPTFLGAEAQRMLARCEEAIAGYQKVLASRPEAKGSRWGAAECAEKLGRKAEAKSHYEEYARRFPDDERASKAREAARRLG